MLGLETSRAPSLDVPAACQGSFGWRILLTRQPDPPPPFPFPPSQNTKEKNRWAGLDEARTQFLNNSCQITTTHQKVPRSPLLPFAITNQLSIAFFFYPTWPYTVLLTLRGPYAPYLWLYFFASPKPPKPFPLPPGWTRISPFLVSDSAPGLDFWAALPPSIY